MTVLSDLIGAADDLDPDAVEHLQRLLAEWQILADLSFADLLLFVRDHDERGVPGFRCVGQMRPYTAQTIYLDDLGSAGLSKLQRIGGALADFRESGKPVIAAADNFGQDAYYIAAHADEVYMHPEGLLFLQGYGVWLNYFKEAIDKLKIDWNVFRVGDYKSAVEPFTRNDMSPEDRAAMSRLVDALWRAYREDVSAARQLEPGALDDLVRRFVEHVRSEDGSIARVALKHGLVDDLLTREEVGERVAELAGRDPDRIEYYNAAPLDDYLAQMRTLRGEKPAQRNVAIIVAAGEILDGAHPPGTIGGDSTARLLRRAKADDKVQAVVLRVDSPGGSAFASEVIRNEVLSLRDAGKPVVASMSSGYPRAPSALGVSATREVS